MKKVILILLLFVIIGTFVGITILKTNENKENFDTDWWKRATLAQVKEKINKGLEVNARNEKGTTVLMYAIGNSQNLDIIEILIKHGADVNTRNKEGVTALMLAAGDNENPDVLETLIKHGADVNTRNKEGITALMLAAGDNENPNVLETLIKHGADINARDKEGVTALMLAASNNQNPKVVETLIKHGADVNARYAEDLTVLMLAASHNTNPEIIEMLIKYGADVNAKAGEGIIKITDIMHEIIKNKDPDILGGITALMCAATNNQNPEVLEALIKHGADIKVKDGDGKTALDFAKENPKIYQTKAYWHLNDLMYK